jgi:hypothetical protein
VVRYNTKKVGTISKTISVYSNAKQSPVVLRIKGKVVAESASALPEKKLENDGSPVNK